MYYDDNTSNEEISKPRSKQGSPRLNYKNVMCCTTKKVPKDKSNDNNTNNLKKNLSSQIIITNHFNFYQNIIISKKDNKTYKGNKTKVNNERILNNIELKGFGDNNNANNGLVRRNNLKNNFLNNWSLLMNKTKGKINYNNSSILFKNTHYKSSSVLLLPDSAHLSANTTLSYSRKNTKDKKQKHNYELHSNKLIKSNEYKNIIGKISINNQSKLLIKVILKRNSNILILIIVYIIIIIVYP